MKVFISWSGETSRNIAEIFRKWLPGVLQAVKPYFTPEDIHKGARWNSEISKELEDSKMGIFFLTPDNLNSLWMMFEAGALSKNIDQAKVVPILFGLEPSDIVGPLTQFQSATFNKIEVKRVVKILNSELEESKLQADVFDNVFDMWWDKLEADVKNELAKTSKKSKPNIRNDRDILEELLSLTRDLSLSQNKYKPSQIPTSAVEDLVRNFTEITEIIISKKQYHLISLLESMAKPIHYLTQKSFGIRSEKTSQMRRVMQKINGFSNNTNKDFIEKETKDNRIIE